MEGQEKPTSSRYIFSKPVQRRSSLFGATFNLKDRTGTNTNIEEETEKYHQRILTEMKQWDTLLLEKSSEISKMKKQELSVDSSVLTEESRNYIETGRNLLKDYFGGYNETKRLINFYLEERMLLLETKKDLNDQLNQIVDEETSNIIEDVLEN